MAKKTQAHVKDATSMVEEIRKILESAPRPLPTPNKAAKPIDADFFKTRPGFWEEYARRQK